MSQIRTGAVSYLNTKPLVYGIDAGPHDLDGSSVSVGESDQPQLALSFDLPSRLADQLKDGNLEVALIPSIEAIANPQYTIVSDACIACDGPVWSVKLFSRVPPEQIRTLALDEGSRTSCGLVRILLDRLHHVRPELSPMPMTSVWQDATTDAVLVIGDRAMGDGPAHFPYSMDLGQAWRQWTGLPFVFAVWASRTRSDLDYIASTLSLARDAGVRAARELALRHAGDYRLSVDQCHDYLTNKLHFHLGDREKQAMTLYFHHAASMGLIAQDLQLQFHDCQVS